MEYYAAETNKLIIRLDKILSYLPHEANKRREHEQNIVTWVNDEDVKLCPGCAKSFNVLRRKHHCRLCGTVQCDNCSQFLPISFARKHLATFGIPQDRSSMNTISILGKLTNPGYVPGAEAAALPEKSPLHAIFSPLKRAGSSNSLTSLTSLIDPGTGEGRIRICSYCKEVRRIYCFLCHIPSIILFFITSGRAVAGETRAADGESDQQGSHCGTLRRDAKVHGQGRRANANVSQNVRLAQVYRNFFSNR